MENETLQDRITRVHKDILGFDNLHKCKQEDIELYLQYTPEELNNLTEDECEFLSIRILQHSIYTQHRLNKIKSAYDWSMYELRKVISSDIKNIKGLSWDNAEQTVINNSPIGLELQNNIQTYKMMISAGDNIVRLLEKYSTKIDNLKFNKKAKVL